MNIYEQIDKNNRYTWLIVTIFVIFFILIGAGFDYYYGVGNNIPVFSIIALVFASFSSVGAYFYGDKMVLSSVHARVLDLSDPKQKQWQNIIEELSIAGGMPCPRTYIIDDPDPNAFATGRNPQNSSIAVTSGLLDVLNREELQGVAAHEMGHIKNFDIRLMLLISVLVGSIALLADWSARGAFRGKGRRNGGSNGGSGVLVILVIWLITAILAPILSQIMAMFVSRRREYLADASGAELTRNPSALASALEKIDARVEPTRNVNKGNAHMWICDPKGSKMDLKEGGVADLLATHPPIKKRIEALKQMAYLSAGISNG